MAQLGAIKVELPARVIEELAKRNSVNYISPDVKLESFGHVTATTGTDLVRNTPSLLAGLLGASAIDGAGIGIAVLHSGIDGGHDAFTPGLNRLNLSKDFTGDGNTGTGRYRHRPHLPPSAPPARFSNV